MDAVVGGKEGGDERDAQVRDGKVGEEQLRVVLSEGAAARGGVVLAEVRQVDDVQDVVLAVRLGGEGELKRSSGGAQAELGGSSEGALRKAERVLRRPSRIWSLTCTGRV